MNPKCSESAACWIFIASEHDAHILGSPEVSLYTVGCGGVLYNKWGIPMRDARMVFMENPTAING